MNVMLLVVVLVQVLVFQVIAAGSSETLPSFLTGVGEPPGESAREAREWGRGRRLPGLLLLAVAGVAGLAGADAAWGKLLLAGVSVTSAILFLVGYVRDRAELVTLGSRLPAPTVRTATLRRSGLGDAYDVRWESLPFVIAGLTLAATLWALADGGGAGLLWLPGVQVAVAGAGLIFSRWYARSGPQLSQRVRASLGDPDTALAIDDRLRFAELRALLGVKVGVVLLLALRQAGHVLATRGQDAPAILAWIEWSVILGLLVVFAGYLLTVTSDVAVRGSRGPST